MKDPLLEMVEDQKRSILREELARVIRECLEQAEPEYWIADTIMERFVVRIKVVSK